ncbi:MULTISPECIES: YrzI family small protein [Bacillaceae]|uniref:YrzI family small protein n=1 Tax=Evansella alkalicola TaxID=745819 RepID=A0ABS6JTH2_9BACI|nr:MULTISPECIES: YrzI family small protein [Bacillaceae]MBU9721886.1 YrzI family small protein [Bacillus alkalicola]
MMFHIFFVTVNISKRKYTAEDIKKEQQREYSRKVRQELLAKRSQYMRLF